MTTSETGPAVHAWLNNVMELVEQLPAIITAREDNALRFGERIIQLHTETQHLVDEALGLSSFSASDATKRLVTALKAEAQTLAAEAKSEHRLIAALSSIAGHAQALGMSCDGFGTMLKSLRFLGLATRIESARLAAEGTNFATLAQEVERLCERIQVSVGFISNDARTLGALIHDLMGSDSSSLNRAMEDALQLRGSLLAGLDKYRAFKDDSVRMAGNISESMSAVSASMEIIVASLQSHDIVRQQLEHAAEALAELPDLTREFDLDVTQSALCAREVVSLQECHLSSAGRQFLKAGGDLEESLSEVARQVGGVLDDARRFTEAGVGADIFRGLIDNAEHAQQALTIMNASKGGARRVLEQVRCAGQDMGAHICEIEDLSADIELLAINAIIQSVRAGEAGEAMGAIAHSIQALSVRAEHFSLEVRRLLEALGAEVQGIDAAPGEDSAETDGRLLTGIDELGADGRSAMNRADSVIAMGRQLQQGIRDTLGATGMHRDVAAEIDAAIGRLTEASAPVVASLPADSRLDNQALLDRLMARYTMESERSRHRSHLGHAAPAEASTGAMGTAPNNAQDDWGNVELF